MLCFNQHKKGSEYRFWKIKFDLGSNYSMYLLDGEALGKDLHQQHPYSLELPSTTPRQWLYKIFFGTST